MLMRLFHESFCIVAEWRLPSAQNPGYVFSGIDIPVFIGGARRIVHSQQLVLGIGLIPSEVYSEAVMEEAPFCTEFDGAADFRFQVTALFYGIYIDTAAYHDDVYRIGDSYREVITDFRP